MGDRSEPAAQAVRRRPALAHQCARCRRHWAMQVVHHPSGTVVLCRYCGALQSRMTRLVAVPDTHPVARLLGTLGPRS